MAVRQAQQDTTANASTAGPDPGLWRQWRLPALLIALLAAVPLVVHSPFLLHGLLITCLWAGLASAWNILSGFGGQLSFGHAAFFGVGAYTMAILYTRLGITPWLGLLAAGFVAAALAAAIGLPAFRLKGPYFSLATLALAEVTRIVAIYWQDLTGGSAGLLLPIEQGWRHMTWYNKGPFLWLTVAFMAVVWVTAAVLMRSRFGYFLAAVREDEDAAAVAGVNVTQVKMGAAMVSAFLTGVGGAILARYLTIVEPEEFLGVQISIQFLIMAIVGGRGTLGGPVLGAFLATPVAEILRSAVGSRVAGGLHQLIYGAIFLVVILFVPQGVWPALARAQHRLFRRSDKLDRLAR